MTFMSIENLIPPSTQDYSTRMCNFQGVFLLTVWMQHIDFEVISFESVTLHVN